LYAPFAARVTGVLVRERQQVRSDQELLTLQAVDRDVREKKADIRVVAVQSELARMPASVQLQENYQVLREQLAQAQAAQQVVAVDKSPQTELSRPLLASVYGGAIDVKQGARGSLVTQDAVFRVLIKPSGALPPTQTVIHGQVRIETQLRFVVENFVYRTLSV